MPRTRIKICGVTTPDALHAAADAGADAIGLVFVPDSPRAIEPDAAFDLMAELPPFMSAVGVFRDPSLDDFSDIEEACPTPMTQFHGDEDEELVRACGPDLIKALRFDPATIARELLRWNAVAEVSAILIDGPSAGAGVAFNWADLVPRLAAVSKPIILAGGLTPENVGEAIRTVRPYAVDVSSGVESSRGVKDPGLILSFCEAVRRADAQ